MSYKRVLITAALSIASFVAHADIIAMSYNKDTNVLTALTDIQCEVTKGSISVSKVRGENKWEYGCWKGRETLIHIELWEGGEYDIPNNEFRIVNKRGQPVDTAIHATV